VRSVLRNVGREERKVVNMVKLLLVVLVFLICWMVMGWRVVSLKEIGNVEMVARNRSRLICSVT
jgi:hypothetical protein